MNIISNAPNWAQKTFKAFAAGQPVEGTEQTPITDEYKNEAGQAIVAIGFMSSMDEQPGMDEAMGQPGVVKSQDTTIYFQGEAENMKAVLNSTIDETGADASVFFSVEQDGLHMLGLANEADGIIAEGAILKPEPNGEFSGYKIAGSVSSN